MLTLVVFRGIALLPPRFQKQALYGSLLPLPDLAEPVDRDHIRGQADGLITLLEYDDLECPHCGQAEPAVREMLTDSDDVRYVAAISR